MSFFPILKPKIHLYHFFLPFPFPSNPFHVSYLRASFSACNKLEPFLLSYLAYPRLYLLFLGHHTNLTAGQGHLLLFSFLGYQKAHLPSLRSHTDHALTSVREVERVFVGLEKRQKGAPSSVRVEWYRGKAGRMVSGLVRRKKRSFCIFFLLPTLTLLCLIVNLFI